MAEEKQKKPKQTPNSGFHGAQRWGRDRTRQEVVLQVVNKRNGAVSYFPNHHYLPESHGMLSKLWFSIEQAMPLSIASRLAVR